MCQVQVHVITAAISRAGYSRNELIQAELSHEERRRKKKATQAYKQLMFTFQLVQPSWHLWGHFYTLSEHQAERHTHTHQPTHLINSWAQTHFRCSTILLQIPAKPQLHLLQIPYFTPLLNILFTISDGFLTSSSKWLFHLFVHTCVFLGKTFWH